ncbi:hypothetical protein ScPMuIL_004782 [Solemya velum]
MDELGHSESEGRLSESSSRNSDRDRDGNPNHFYILYSYNPDRLREGRSSQSENEDELEDICLSVLATDLCAPAETEVRSYLSQRLSKVSNYNDSGTVISLDISLSEDEMTRASCYYCLCETRSSIDIIGSENIDSMSRHLNNVTFHGELDSYSLGILKYLDTEPSDESMCKDKDTQLSQIDTTVKEYLESWFDISMAYTIRCLASLNMAIKWLIYIGLTDAKLVIQGGSEQLQNDIKKFLKACSMAEILQQLHPIQSQPQQCSPTVNGLDLIMDMAVEDEDKTDSDVVTLHINQNSVIFEPNNCTGFCEEWAASLIKKGNHSATACRQLIEVYKLKFIHSMNSLKRLLKQAENNYYALYRSFVFLKNSGNCDLLLHYAKVECRHEIGGVLQALEEFIKENNEL